MRLVKRHLTNELWLVCFDASRPEKASKLHCRSSRRTRRRWFSRKRHIRSCKPARRGN